MEAGSGILGDTGEQILVQGPGQALMQGDGGVGAGVGDGRCGAGGDLERLEAWVRRLGLSPLTVWEKTRDEGIWVGMADG